MAAIVDAQADEGTWSYGLLWDVRGTPMTALPIFDTDLIAAHVYKNLLLRTQANISKDPAEQQRLLREADDLRKQAEDLRNKQRAAAGDSATK